jgi:hypothetical protein
VRLEDERGTRGDTLLYYEAISIPWEKEKGFVSLRHYWHF